MGSGRKREPPRTRSLISDTSIIQESIRTSFSPRPTFHGGVGWLQANRKRRRSETSVLSSDRRELGGTGGKGKVASRPMTAGEAVREASAGDKDRGSWGG